MANTEIQSLITLKIILRLFSKVSSLEINYNKSSFVPFNLQPTQVQQIKLIFQCQQTTLPVIYLGMPLTVNRPPKQCFMPLIEKIEGRLQGWKGKLMSRGGRAQLVASVLSSIPIYVMNCFRLPKWLVQKIDRVRRLFLWGKNAGDARGISLINWETTILPKKWGGMGLRNIELQNISLLLRWLWQLYQDQSSIWKYWALRLCERANGQDGPMLWLRQGSFFWSQLLKIESLFQWFTSWSIKSGQNISLWFDRWQHEALRTHGDGLPRPAAYAISLADMMTHFSELCPTVQQPILVQGRDILQWRWCNSGIYTANNAYEVMQGGGKVKWGYAAIWKAKCPATAKIFAFLMIRNKILTQDVLRKRRILIHAISG